MRELNKEQLNTVMALINRELRENKDSHLATKLRNLNVLNSLRCINLTNAFKAYIIQQANDINKPISDYEAQNLTQKIINTYNFKPLNDYIKREIKSI